MSALEALSSDDKQKLNSLIEAGKRQLQEMDDIRGSLRDTVKGLAEELGIKPKFLTMAIRIAYKNDLASKKEDMDTVEDILHATGNA